MDLSLYDTAINWSIQLTCLYDGIPKSLLIDKYYYYNPDKPSLKIIDLAKERFQSTSDLNSMIELIKYILDKNDVYDDDSIKNKKYWYSMIFFKMIDTVMIFISWNSSTVNAKTMLDLRTII